jgi:bifunctional DNA-binding transcriptional regulator/antitoxin component of YhaV-PrlF toxin-antitoxin module
MGYEIKIAANGRFVLPLDVRKMLDLEHGGKMHMQVEDGEIVMQTTAHRIRQAQNMAAEAFAGFEGSAVDAFLADKAEQARREAENQSGTAQRAA